MVSEPHVTGTEFGELQLAMWTSQFEALRDGDRFFYANDPVLEEIADVYGIDYRRTLADVIVANTELESSQLASNVFLVAADDDGSAPTEPGSDDDEEQQADRPRRHGDDDRRGPGGRRGRGRR